MNYNLLKDSFSPLLGNNRVNLQKSKKLLETIKPDDSFDKHVLSILNSIHKNIEICDSLQQLAIDIFKQSKHFSDDSIHQSTKLQALKKILAANNYVENNKLFNLTTLQTYVDGIIQKQLYEINIKIEENQRALNNLSFSSSSRKENGTEPAKKLLSFILVEHEQKKCAINHDDILEILKFDEPFSKSSLKDFTMLYSKICGQGQKNVMKKNHDLRINRNQVIGNANMTFANTEDKNFALLMKHDDDFSIFFVDYVLYTNPVEAEDLGGEIDTSDGRYKILEV